MKKRSRALRLPELVAISLGGMIGGGIFSILGVAAEQAGNLAPVGIAIGAVVALLAAYPYAQLTRLYRDEGATYSFFKRTFPRAPVAGATVGWLVVFGYIATLALYAFTFASYATSMAGVADGALSRAVWAGGVLAAMTALNAASVRWTGRVEDALVYAKLAALVLVGAAFLSGGDATRLSPATTGVGFGDLVTVAAMTFVAFEGFQLAIHAYNEVERPERNVPRAIYISVATAGAVYVLLAVGAVMNAPIEVLVRDKEFAVAAAAGATLGSVGQWIVLGGALLATSSAIVGTLFGASRLMAVVADDGNMPAVFRRRIHGHTPHVALAFMAAAAMVLVATGGLQLIVEFGSITFIGVSLAIAVANVRVRRAAGSSSVLSWASVVGLSVAAVLLVAYQLTHDPQRFGAVAVVALVLVGGARRYARAKNHRSHVATGG